MNDAAFAHFGQRGYVWATPPWLIVYPILALIYYWLVCQEVQMMRHFAMCTTLSQSYRYVLANAVCDHSYEIKKDTQK